MKKLKHKNKFYLLIKKWNNHYIVFMKVNNVETNLFYLI